MVVSLLPRLNLKTRLYGCLKLARDVVALMLSVNETHACQIDVTIKAEADIVSSATTKLRIR